MASRSRSTSVGRRSWKESGRETSRPLTIYRRVITLVLCLVLVGAFLAALWYVPKGDKPDRWTFERLLVATYDRGAAPPLVFAKNDEAAIPDFFGEDLAGRGTDADNLLREIRALPESSADAMFLYLAGHGLSRMAKGDGDAREVAFLLPSDYDMNAPTERVNVTALLTAVAQHPSKRKLLVIDYGPLERDLRIGTAVNNFAGVLESEFLRLFASGEEKLLKDGDVLLVIASHRRWEQSLVSPVDGRSAFNYFALEALTSPEANADIVCPDGDKPNQRISALEFARFVQWQVDHWAWNATSQQRTQRPLVLFADSSGEPAALELERVLKKEEIDQDPVLTRLAKMTLREAPKAAAKEEEKSEKAAGRALPIAMLALAQPAAETEKNPEAAPEKKPEEGPAKAGTPTPAEPKTPPPLAWVSSQHHALDLLLGTDALSMETARGGWAAVDADHVQVRQQLEALLQQQQARLNPNNTPQGDLADPLSTRTREAVLNWAQANKRWEEFPEIIAAMHVRDRMLAEFALLQELVDRVDDIYLTRVNQAAIDAVESLAALCDKLEREGVIDERIRDAGNTLYSAAPSEGKYSTASEVGQAAVTAWTARGKLLDALQAAFKSDPPTVGKDPGLWLGRWQTLLHAPLATIAPQVTSIAFSKPAVARMKLAVATKLFDASAKNVNVPTPSDRTEVVARVASARMQWLELQERFCRMTPPQLEPISLSGIGRDVAAFNAAAQAIAQRRENAAAALRTQAITDDWQRDRAARLLGVVDPSEAAPLVKYKLIDKPVFLRLAGPRDRSGQMQSDAISLSTDKPLALVWNIESSGALPLDRMKVKFEFDDEAVQVESHEQKAISPGVESRASDFVKGRELTLHLLARHEVSAEESKKPPALKITLTYDRTRSVAAESRLVLPNSRYLQVVLEASEMNLNLRELDRRAEDSKAFLVRAAEVIGNGAPAAGSCFHVPLRPYPSGTTAYRLALFNRSEGKRAIKAQWFAPVDTDATSPEWLDVRRLTSREPLSDPIPLAFDKFGELELPLYPPPKAPAAGTAPPAPAEGAPMKNVSLNRGLICVLSDESDREWKQYLWITARPLRPRDYLSATAEFDAKTSTARVSVKPKGEASPSEPAPLIGDPLGTERIVFGTPDKKRQELSGTVAAGQPPTLTNPLRFAAKIDNYPRGFQFRIQSSAQVVAAAPEAYAALELFAEPEVPMPGKPPEPLGKITYWQKPQKLNYRVHADFLEDRQCALRLSLNGGVDTPLELFTDDRAFDLQCLKSEPGAPPKFIVKCDTQDFAGSFEGDTFAGSRRMAYRAEVVKRAGQRWEALSPPVFDERVIIIDRLPPEIVHRKQDKTIVLGSKGVVSFVFEVQDGNGDNDDSASGVRLEDITWSTSEKPDGAQPIKDLLPVEITDAHPRRRWELRAHVDPKLLKKPDTFTVWIHAKDASGRTATSRGVISVTVNQPVPDKEFTVKEKVPKGK